MRRRSSHAQCHWHPTKVSRNSCCFTDFDHSQSTVPTCSVTFPPVVPHPGSTPRGFQISASRRKGSWHAIASCAAPGPPNGIGIGRLALDAIFSRS